MATRGIQLAAVIVLLAVGLIARGDDYIWTGDVGTFWSQRIGSATNWAGGLLPVSSDTTRLTFDQSAHGYNLSNDIAEPFVLNQITFGGAGFNLGNASLKFAGTGAGIVQNSAADQSFSMPINLSVATTVGGTGTGTVSFGGAITGNGSLITSVPVELLTTTVSLAGSQTYSGPVVLNQFNTTLTSSGGGDISLNGPVDGAIQATIAPLIVHTSGVTRLGGVFGGVRAPYALFVDPLGSTEISSSSITTVNDQDYGNPVNLAAGTTLSASSVVFRSTLNGGFGLTVANGTKTTFLDAVGGTSPLASLTLNGNAVLKGGPIITGGAQTYNLPVTLGANATLTSIAGGNIFFAQTIDGAFGLTVKTNGSATFAGLIGSTTPLASFTTDTAAPINTLPLSIKTTGAQSFNNTLLLQKDLTLTSTGSGNISLAGAQGSSGLLTVNTAGTTTFAGSYSTRGISTDAPGVTSLNNASIVTATDVTFRDPVLTTGVTNLSQINTTVNVTFNSTLDGPGAVSFIDTFPTLVGAVGSNVPLASLSTGSRLTIVKGGLVRTTGGQSYGPLTLVGNTTLKSEGSGDITISDIQAPALTVLTAGVTTFSAAIFGTGLGQITTDAPGRTALTGGTLTTTGAQTFGDAVTIRNTTTLTSSGNASITLAGSVNSASNSGSSLVVNTTGVSTFGGPIGDTIPLHSLTTNAGGSTVISGGSIKTFAEQFYNDSVILSTSTAVTTNSNLVRFFQKLDGPGGLAIDASSTTTFSGAVGSITPLGSLATAGTTTINGGTIITTGAQSYSGPIMLNAATVLTSIAGGDVTLNKNGGGAFPLTINTSGRTSINGFSGSSLTTDAPGQTLLDFNSIVTTNSQSYNDPVSLVESTSLRSTGGGNIVFASTLNGAFFITLTTGGNIHFGDAIGSTTPLASLIMSGFDIDGTAVTAGQIAQNSGGGTTTFSGTLHATGPTGVNLKGTNFALSAVTVNNGPFSVTTSGVSTVSGVVSGFASLSKSGAGSLTLSAANTYTGITTINAGLLRVSGSIANSAGVTVNDTGTFEAANTQRVRALTVNNGGLAKVTAGTLTVGTGSSATPLVIATGAGMDITSNSLVVDYSAGNEDATFALVQSKIKSGYNGGDWMGSGIFSSAAASNPGKAIGFAQASEILGPSGGPFMGQVVDGTSMLVRYTLAGDTDLNGTVDFNDLAKLAQSYNVTDGTTRWSSGDFNYDGNTDFLDLAMLAQNYNTALPSAAIPGASTGFAADMAMAFALVPEPSVYGLTIWVIVLGGANRRRRRLSPRATSSTDTSPATRSRVACP